MASILSRPQYVNVMTWFIILGVGGAVRFLVVGTIGQGERPALDGAVFDIAQILAYLVHNMSRSQLYLGFGHFG